MSPKNLSQNIQASQPISNQRKILVIDDDEDSLKLILEPLLWEGYDARGATSSSSTFQLIDRWKPHIVLIDWTMPTTREINLLKKVRETSVHTACIFLSNNSTTEAIIEGLDTGADDYIVKPFVPLELLARIRTHLRIRELHEELILANEKLKELVDIDDLTGLYNMRSLYQRLDFELERARRFKRKVCVVMMDIDYFKSVNDKNDHLFGSYVLSEVGRLIKQNTRNIDIPARYGGDEFLVVLTETTHEGAINFCEQLRRSVEDYVFKNETQSIRLTVSMGFTENLINEKVSAKDFVRRADHALYEAKRLGRNKVCFYQPQSANEKTIDKSNVIELTPKTVKKKIAG